MIIDTIIQCTIIIQGNAKIILLMYCGSEFRELLHCLSIAI